MLLTESLVRDIEAARGRGEIHARISPDLGRTVCEVAVHEDGCTLGHERFVFPAKVRPRTIYHQIDGTWEPVSRFGTALYKLVPTDWGPPVFEIDGIKMLVSQSVSPLEDARRKVALARVQGEAVLDTCGGLGYFAVAALEQGARSITSFEKSEEVRWLRTVNPWSPAEDPRLHLTAGNVLDHLAALRSGGFGVILHDPPRFGIAGELYALSVYEEFARLLAPGGRLFHYVGTPNRLTTGRDVPLEVTRRLNSAGFVDVQSVGDGLLAQRARRSRPIGRPR